LLKEVFCDIGEHYNLEHFWCAFGVLPTKTFDHPGFEANDRGKYMSRYEETNDRKQALLFESPFVENQIVDIH
jgi:hypothetical protein